jgi:SnoaL-like domain
MRWNILAILLKNKSMEPRVKLFLTNINTMDTNNYIDLAKTYVALSNKHNLELIAQMFAADTTYYSSYFGEFKGCVAINDMMISFFSRFSDAYWNVETYRLIGDRCVEFAFIMTGTDATSGEHVERHGVEQIHFAPDGLISHIAVLKPEETSET